MDLKPPTNVWCHLDHRALLSVSGEEWLPFLQGLVSNDVAKLETERARYAALLSPQGKCLFDFLVIATDHGVLLEVEASRRQALQQRLMLYRLRAKVEIAPVDDLAVFAWLVDAAASEAVPAEVRVIADGRHRAMGARVIGPVEATRAWLASKAPEMDTAAYRRHRLALGVPEGSGDLEPDKALLLESGFVELDGVCFDKGCFVGQELTARMRYRATVRKRLLPVRIEGVATAGAAITAGSLDVGELRDIEGEVGLALIRLDRWDKAREAGRPLQAGDAVIEPSVPDWVDLDFASKRAESSA